MVTYTFADGLDRMGGEGAAEMNARARALEAAGRRVIHLEVGEPDFDTPAHIKRRAIQALTENHTHYTSAQGILPLREAIARYVNRTRGVSVDPAQIAVGPGCKDVIFTVLSALIRPGDEVIYPGPCYPAYEAIVSYLGGTAIPVPVQEALDFRFAVADLEALVTPRTRMVILNSPQNPTGGVLTGDDVQAIAELAERRDFLIMSDEIYSRILYTGVDYPSIYSRPGMVERTVLIDGFSKSYAMTGWRLGYAVMPLPVCQKVVRLLVNSVSCVTSFVQWAGIEALEGPQDDVEAMVAEFARRRAAMVAGLNRIPHVRCREPHGAFYAFPYIGDLGYPSKFVADYLLQEAGVAVLSGTAFGALGEGYLRLSYANSLENIETAIESMRVALTKLPSPAAAGTC